MNRQTYQEATEWLVEFRTEEIDRTTRTRFEEWLTKSPEHVQAYLEVSGIWESVGAQPPSHPADIESLIERARATANVISFGGGRDDRASSPSAHRSVLDHRRALLATAATLLLTIITAGAYLYTQHDLYTTDVGEQRSILLYDGSTIDLNARSKVRVSLDDHERHIDLIEGQALFRVAKDKTRPFIVAANGTRVRAVGTQFDINRRKRGTIVTVVEGTVAISSDSGGASSQSDPRHAAISAEPGETLLRAGEQLTLATVPVTAGTASAPAIASHADIDTITAWTQRRLIFDSTPLEDVAEEFNRNNTRRLVIEGPGLEDFHISGAFSSTNPEPLLRFLRAQPGIRITDQRDRIVVSRSD